MATKLTAQDALTIRTSIAAGTATQSELAKQFGVSQAAISHVVNNVTHKGFRRARKPRPRTHVLIECPNCHYRWQRDMRESTVEAPDNAPETPEADNQAETLPASEIARITAPEAPPEPPLEPPAASEPAPAPAETPGNADSGSYPPPGATIRLPAGILRLKRGAAAGTFVCGGSCGLAYEADDLDDDGICDGCAEVIRVRQQANMVDRLLYAKGELPEPPEDDDEA